MTAPKIQLPHLGGRATKYGYSNARVKGMKGLLLKGSEMDELLKVKTMDAVVELLQRTHYKDDLAQLSLLYKGSTLVELAAGRHFGRLARKILKLSPKSDRKIVQALLKRWDIQNLKTVIGAKRSGKKFEEIKPYLVAVGSLSESDLERISKAEDRMVFDEIRATGFGKEMLSESTNMFTAGTWEVMRGAVKSMDNLLQMQALLDEYAYVYIDRNLISGSKDVQGIKRLFKKEIDAKNIAIIERVKARGIDKAKIKKYMIKGGTLNDATMNALIDAKDFNAVISIAKSKLSGLDIGADNVKNIVDLEISLEKAIAREKLRAFYRSVLSIGILLGFLLLKEEELHNLRKIAKGKEFNIPEDKLKEMLVMV